MIDFHLLDWWCVEEADRWWFCEAWGVIYHFQTLVGVLFLPRFSLVCTAHTHTCSCFLFCSVGAMIIYLKMCLRHWKKRYRTYRLTMLIYIWYITYSKWILFTCNFFHFDVFLLLLKIHWPASLKKESLMPTPEMLTKPDITSTWKAMEALYDSGKARAIGVSNFSSKKLTDLLNVARVTPAVNQVECHPVWQQQGLHELCKSKGVHLSVSILTNSKIYSVFASMN